MFYRFGIYFLLRAGFSMDFLQAKAEAATAKAEIRGTALEPELNGEAAFTQQDGKMQVDVKIQGAHRLRRDSAYRYPGKLTDLQHRQNTFVSFFPAKRKKPLRFADRAEF